MFASMSSASWSVEVPKLSAENLSFEASFCYVIFLSLADDVLKMYYLGGRPEAGVQVLMWKAWQVWPRME